MPFEMNPRTRKIIESLGCDLDISGELARKIMMEYLEEAEHMLEEQVLNVGDSPNLMLLHAVRRIPGKFSELRAESRRNIENGRRTKGVDGTSLARLIALLAVSATSALKDLAFIISRGVRCSTCDRSDKCEGNDGGHDSAAL